jgi:hypothetical protein
MSAQAENLPNTREEKMYIRDKEFDFSLENEEYRPFDECKIEI